MSSSTTLAFDLDWNDLHLDDFWCDGNVLERVLLGAAGAVGGLVFYEICSFHSDITPTQFKISKMKQYTLTLIFTEIHMIR